MPPAFSFPTLWKVAVWSFLVLLLFGSQLTHAKVAELAWDANPEPNIVSYTLRYGKTSGSYSESVTVSQTDVTLTNLTAGTYYCTVTARNSDGLESAPSEELSFEILIDAPKVAGLSDGQSLNANGSIQLSFSAWDAGTARVEIYAGSTLVGSANNQASTLTWSATVAGDYPLTVMAYDGQGNVVSSEPVNIRLVRPAVTDLKRTTDSAFEMMVTGAPGRRQRVEVSEDLKTWAPFADEVNATGAMIVRDEAMAQMAKRFYRVVSE